MSDADITTIDETPRGIGLITQADENNKAIINPNKKGPISEEKKLLITAYLQQGYSFRQISGKLKTSSGTIQKIKDEMMSGIHKNDGIVAAIKEGNADYLLKQAVRGIEAVDDEKLQKASLRDIAIYSGTMIDKFRLLSNQSTQNVATLHTFFRKSESADTSLSG